MALTAYSAEVFTVKSVEAGMDCFVTKPVTSEAILSIIMNNYKKNNITKSTKELSLMTTE